MKPVAQSPEAGGFVMNPYPFYQSVREAGDFVYWTDLGMAVATTDGAVSEILKHPKCGRADPAAAPDPGADDMPAFRALLTQSMFHLEPPRHTRLRALVQTTFNPERVAALSMVVSVEADALIDTFTGDRIDVVGQFTQPLALSAMRELLGLYEGEDRDLQAWAWALNKMDRPNPDAGTRGAAEAAAVGLSKLFSRQTDRHRQRPGTGMIADLVATRFDGEQLSDAEIFSACAEILSCGLSIVAGSLGNAILALAGYEQRKLALKPQYVGGTIEECLRFEAPLQFTHRFVYEETMIAGERFRRGDRIGCLIGSACRDDAVWPDGDRFDPFRSSIRNLALGTGIHACIGSELARLEHQISLPALFSRCPEITAWTEPEFATAFPHRWVAKLSGGL